MRSKNISYEAKFDEAKFDEAKFYEDPSRHKFDEAKGS